MEKNKSSVAPHEKEFIENREKEISQMLDAIEQAKRFNLGDILVASRVEYDGYNDMRMLLLSRSFKVKHNNTATPEPKMVPVVTQVGGARIKYKVIAVDKHGLPYIKKLDVNGKPNGEMISIYNTRNYGQNLIYELDPHFADALILGNESEYDPMREYAETVRITKEVTEHNKSCKLSTRREDLIDTVSSFKVNDIVWKSAVNNFTVLEIYELSSKPNHLLNEKCLKVQNTKGQILTINLLELHGKNLYSKQPRSLKKELSSLK